MSVVPVLAETGTRKNSLVRRLRLAFPTWRVAALGPLFWAASMAASAAINLVGDGWETPAKIVEVTIVFAAGAAVAFPLGYAASTILAGNRGWETRLAAAFLCFTVVTVGVTGTFYALDYRQYYANWHAEAFSWVWMHQFAFTVAGALVQFAVTGVRFYFPIGFAALAAVSIWFARRAR
jgi:hypothetical protein